MNRWLSPPPRHPRADRFAPPALPWQLMGALAVALCSAASAQVAPASAWVVGAASQPKRTFPANAQRAQMSVLNAHEVSMNGKTTRLSPGSRIHSPGNALVVSGKLIGQTFVVNHVRDTMGQVHEVWILNDAETAERRPGSDGMSISNVNTGTP